ncbi:unnamed protein product [Polarella glacialis]|uniref:Ribosomal protein n=1 Tax=Polarella glacialis TaxID=89957 RepID=A0A813EAD9_POLGL|nr:unnamed protein product [Polarella glacialis]|mmetsp:Transcript_30395/g.48706  ORF Transcript_30395/g.48706 Transcript_30395/m.48706 type:complete len:381 (+) Transcript_30395:65-1207(+)
MAAEAVPKASETEGETPNDDVRVKKAMLQKAVKALVQVIAKKSANANPLFDSSSETMTLQLTLTKIPERRVDRPVIIRLPHPMYDAKSEVCFICKDPQKKYKELLLTKHPVPGLTKVIGVTKLKKNYKEPKDKRALCDSFDLFLCDKRVVEMMPKVLGVVFYKKKLKPPIPVHIKEGLEDPKLEIEKAISGTCFRLPSGPCVGVKFGRCSMPEEHLAANAAAVIATSIKLLNRSGILLQSISVQATGCPALPVWRRPAPPGSKLDLKKYRADAASSAASDTGASGISDSEITGSDITSDAGETLSTRDTVSEVDTASDIGTAGETLSEMDSEDDDVSMAKEDLPLLQGLKSKKRKLGGSAPAAAVAAPPKKAKKMKGKAA